jgi:DNA-binding PadR family transcriptional regulator
MFKDMFFHSHSHKHFAHPRGRGRDCGWGHGGGRRFMGEGGVPGGRKLSSSDLQLILLALLSQAPAHGYELIKAIEEKSKGFYVPSPGVIYPALTYLEEIGHASVEADGNRKRYQITEEGRKQLEANKATADDILNMLSRIGNRMEQVREAFSGVDDDQPDSSDELHRARRDLKEALKRSRDCTPAEARRIARILARAAAEIAEGQKP